MSDLRLQILTAAKNLLIEQGYHGLSMRQIAEAVGVSKAALYYHFKDKEELLLGIMYPYFYPAHAQDLPAPADVAQQLVSIFLDGIVETRTSVSHT